MDGDAHDFAGLDELSRDADVFTAWLDVPRWVVVRKNQGGRISKDSHLEHLARLDDGDGQASDADLGQTRDDVGRVQEDN